MVLPHDILKLTYSSRIDIILDWNSMYQRGLEVTPVN